MPHFISNGATIMIAVLLVLAIAYRYYSAFLAVRVLALDGSRATPAHTLRDGQNYYPTNKWVLFGHHFAAISGAGPLIGPVLAAQFGYMPGLLWILIGVCLAGAVQDFTILVFSMRRGGKSLAQIAFSEIGSFSGTAATIGILFVLVIALAGLGKVVTTALGGDTISYGPGTEFREVAIGKDKRQVAAIAVHDNSSALWTRYRIEPGVVIEFPNHVTQTVSSRMDLLTRMADGSRDPGFLKRGEGNLRVLRVPDKGLAEEDVPGSAWGTFTIAATIPIALFIGFYMYRVRKGKVLEASIIGGLLTLGAVYVGGMIVDPYSPMSAIAESFNLSKQNIGYAMAIYGFVASILPVWLLLCPRDYLSSFLKIGTVALLVIGVILAHPQLHAPAFNATFSGGGPVVGGPVLPFVFITIMCGAVSGFHALVSSGTTPKMIDKETDAHTIGYGAMLIEGLVGIVALIAAAGLPVQSYYNINTPPKDIPKYGAQIAELAKNDKAAGIDDGLPDVGEHVEGRTGGAVTLAIGMAKIFNDSITNVTGATPEKSPWLAALYKYWYHFAIMFEALFILTTIDTGTRVGRFLLQETMGKWVHPKFGKTDWWPSAVIATALITGGWLYFLNANAFAAIWSMFGVANQMLAVMALAIATAVLAQNGKKKYVAITFVPMCVVAITTTWAAVLLLMGYIHVLRDTAAASGAITNTWISACCLIAILACAAVVVTGAVARIGLKPVAKPVEVIV